MAPGNKTGGGSRAGRPNKRSVDIEHWAKEAVENAEYRANLEDRLRKGKLPPAMEAMLFHYAYGKPRERIEHSGSIGVRAEDMDQLSDAQLLALLASRNSPGSGIGISREAEA